MTDIVYPSQISLRKNLLEPIRKQKKKTQLNIM